MVAVDLQPNAVQALVDGDVQHVALVADAKFYVARQPDGGILALVWPACGNEGDYRSKWVGFFGLDTSLRDLVIFFRAPSTNELLGVAQLISQDQDSSMGLDYVRSSIAELLGLFEQPEGAPQC